MRAILPSALVLGMMAVGTLAPTGAAAEPVALTDSQMDRVVAGQLPDVPGVDVAVNVAVVVPVLINVCAVCGDTVDQSAAVDAALAQAASQG